MNMAETTRQAQDKAGPTVPYSSDVEEALLGSVLVEPGWLDTLAAVVRPEDFFIVRNAWVWESILDLYNRGDSIDYLTVLEDLQAKGRLAELGGAAYLTQLINRTPMTMMADTYAQIVVRSAMRRRLLASASEIARLAHSEDTDVFGLVEQAHATLDSIVENRVGPGNNLQPLAESLSMFFDSLSDSKAVSLETGFVDLDRMLGSVLGGDLVIVAGRPGMGKTSWLLTLSLNVAQLLNKQGSNQPVLYFSLEMGAEQIVQRFISMETGIPLKVLRKGQLDDSQLSQVAEAISKLSELPILIDERSNLTPASIKQSIRDTIRLYGQPAVVIVDYAQLLQVEHYIIREQRLQGETEQHTYISKSLKEMARAFSVPVIAAAQLNRQVEQARDKRPHLSHLRNSGTYEQDADIVLFLYRDEVYNPNTDKPGVAEVIVAKHRHGETGTVELFFDKSRTRFGNLARASIDLGALTDTPTPSKPAKTSSNWKSLDKPKRTTPYDSEDDEL